MCCQVQLCTFLGDGDRSVNFRSNYSLRDPFPTPQIQEQGRIR